MRRTPIILLAAAAFVVALPTMAKPAFVAKAKAAGIADAKCTTCHTKMGAKDLNEVGKVAKASMKDGEPDYAAVKKAIK
jgi:cytochrome c553